MPRGDVIAKTHLDKTLPIVNHPSLGKHQASMNGEYLSNNNYIHPQRIHPAFECGLKIFIFQQFFSMTCAQGGKLLLALVHHEYMLYKLVMCIRSYFIPSLNVHFYVDIFRIAGTGE